MPLPDTHGPKRPAALLPAADHIAYLANLLMVMAILYGVWQIGRDKRRDRKRPPGTIGAADVPQNNWGY